MLYKRWKGRLLLFLAVFLAAVLFFSQAAAAGRIEDKVLRLHVIANSDSEEDQALKLRVRDRILAEAADLFAPGETVAQARETLTLALPAVRTCDRA